MREIIRGVYTEQLQHDMNKVHEMLVENPTVSMVSINQDGTYSFKRDNITGKITFKKFGIIEIVFDLEGTKTPMKMTESVNRFVDSNNFKDIMEWAEMPYFHKGVNQVMKECFSSRRAHKLEKRANRLKMVAKKISDKSEEANRKANELSAPNNSLLGTGIWAGKSN